MKEDEIAEALRETLISPNVLDSNWESANIVDVIDKLARAIQYGLKQLGNGDTMTPMGALELHGKAILDGSEKIASAIQGLAEAIREHGIQ